MGLKGGSHPRKKPGPEMDVMDSEFLQRMEQQCEHKRTSLTPLKCTHNMSLVATCPVLVFTWSTTQDVQCANRMPF